MRDSAVIVAGQSRAKVGRAASVEMSGVGFALQDIYVREQTHYLVACRVVARNVSVAKARLRQGYGAAVFALHFVASEDWRRGESNPCPRRYPRKHLHVYPAINSKEPSHAPAHCQLPSVREIDSQTGAVAPPIRQPAVHVFAASRRHCENVAVN